MSRPVFLDRNFTLLVAATCCFSCSTPAPGPGVTAAGVDGAAFGDGLQANSDATPKADAAADEGLTDGSGADNPQAKCQEGHSACHNATVAKFCVQGAWELKDQCKGGEVCKDGACAKLADCKPGKSGGCDGYATELVCSADGTAWLNKKCPPPQQCAEGMCRDVVCTPGIAECDGKSTIKTCKSDGSGFSAPTACKSGSTCFAGKCLSDCESNIKVASNLGCEYWIADLDNETDIFSAALHPKKLTPDMIPHSVVVSNPGQYDAEITFTLQSACNAGVKCLSETTCGGLKTVCDAPIAAPYDMVIADKVVKAGGSREFIMPVLNIDGSGIFRRAVQMRSTQPVIAYQFNPFDSQGAASNDGSLLLPVNTLGKVYYAVGWPSFPDGINIPGLPTPSQKGYLTVVAVKPKATKVTITLTNKAYAAPTKGVNAPNGGKFLEPGPHSFTLQQFDVLNLHSVTEFNFSVKIGDLTGSKVEADQVVSVFVGHEEAVVGPLDKNSSGGSGQDPNQQDDSCCAEHIEEQLIPWEAWGTEAFCVKTKPRGQEPDIWTVVAGEANVTLKTVPSIPGLDGKVLKNAGDSLRADATQSFMLKATGKIQVAQLLVSRGWTQDFTGDPSLMMVPPAKQYRSDYVIRTGDGYGKSWTSVVRPKGVEVKLDGVAVPDASFQAFGDGTWEFAYVAATKKTHAFEAKEPFGLMVYGYGNATAYGYPGGMNLK